MLDRRSVEGSVTRRDAKQASKLSRVVLLCILSHFVFESSLEEAGVNQADDEHVWGWLMLHPDGCIV